MKSDIQGCSTCQPGQEQYEFFYSPIARGKRVQYDYRAHDGKLFSTVAKSLEQARERRDNWLKKQVQNA